MACTPLTINQIIAELNYNKYTASTAAPYYKTSENANSNFYSNLAALSYTSKFSFPSTTYYEMTADDLKNNYLNFVSQNFPNIFASYPPNFYNSAGILNENAITKPIAAVVIPTSATTSFTSGGSFYKVITLPKVSDIDKQQYSALLEIYIKQLNDEYCYYYSIYKFGLKALLSDIAYYNNNTPPSTDAINSAQNSILMMNRRCEYLLYCMEYIKRALDTDSTNLSTVANTDEEAIKKATKEIVQQNKMLQQNGLNSDVYKKMVTYTYEKNKYSSNILALYGGLNIVAIALLVYIYRS